MRIFATTVTLIASCALAAVAQADAESAPSTATPPASALEAGMTAYEELDYQRAVDRLSAALDETDDRNQRIGILRTRAFAYAALDRRDDARADFEHILKIDAGFTLDRTISPRVRDIFDHAQARVRAETTTALLPVLPDVNALTAQPPPPPRKPIAKRPWFWVGLVSGVAVAAAATATALILTSGQPGEMPTTTRVLIRAP